jgi:N-acetylglucosamine kinase-like BadF-type ATPase
MAQYLEEKKELIKRKFEESMVLNSDYTIIGIDGGGTHTRGVLYQKGKFIAESNTGTSRIHTVGVGEACERTLNIIQDLCNKSEIESSEIDAIVVGLAGVWLDEEKMRAATLLRTLARSNRLIINDISVVSDAEIAYEGALNGEDGIIMIVGTGSIGLARIGKGKFIRCGGWGIELDDEGSGAWIGKEALTAIVRHIDGRGKPTKLTEAFANKFKSVDLKNPRTIVKAYADGTFVYSQLSPLAMELAEDGDEIALEIINRSAHHLVELPQTLLANFKTKKVKVAMMGGIIHNKTLLARKIEEILNENPIYEIVKVPNDVALWGAISLGLKMIESNKEL